VPKSVFQAVVEVQIAKVSVEQLQPTTMPLCLNGVWKWSALAYEAERAEHRYRTVEPENRLVARGLETEWENRLRDLAEAEMELRRREQQRPTTISLAQLQPMQRLGSDIDVHRMR
jgi:hypothetical protein